MENKITKSMVEIFAKTIIEQFSISKKMLNYGNDEKFKDIFPHAFTSESASVKSYYSTDRDHLLIVFFKKDDYEFSFKKVKGNVFDVYDKHNLWRTGAGITMENSNGTIKNFNSMGMRPIDLYGKVELILEDFKFMLPYPRYVMANLHYAFVFSKKVFLEKYEEQKQYASQIIMNYEDFFDKKGEKFKSDTEKAEEYKKSLEELKLKMEEYFFTERYRETEIDNFISQYPEILKYGLNLTNTKSQVLMKDIHGQYKQDLKPDLIGFDSTTELWTIVDYKLPWKKLVRGSGTVRASFTSDIAQLRKQLKVYRDYFKDKSQREYVNNLYDLDVKTYPATIGVIGTVKTHERDEFNEERQDLPTWFKVMSYDELYKKVCDYIDIVKNIS